MFMNNKLEELKIYQAYTTLVYYTYKITEKYPKYEKVSLVSDIKHVTNNGVEYIIKAQKEHNVIYKLSCLNQVDASLKTLKLYIRVSYKFKYINSRNYGAWSKKVANISNMLNGWFKLCAKQ